MEDTIRTQFTEAGLGVQSVHQDGDFWHVVLDDNTDCQMKSPDEVAGMIEWIKEHPAPTEGELNV